MNKKYVMLDLDDDRISSLADVLGNKTSKKIIDYLAEKEASETEISQDLKIPANTVNYNIKKLFKAGLIEKSKDYWWSVKGKKIRKYRVANKKIVISPKSFGTGSKVFVSLIVAGFAAIGIKFFTQNQFAQDSTSMKIAEVTVERAGDYVAAGASQGVNSVSDVASGAVSQMPLIPEVALWFFLGAVFALIVFMLLNMRRR